MKQQCQAEHSSNGDLTRSNEAVHSTTHYFKSKRELKHRKKPQQRAKMSLIVICFGIGVSLVSFVFSV